MEVRVYERIITHDEDVREEGRAEGRAEGEVKGTIRICKDFGLSFEETVTRVREMFQLPDNEVQRDMKLYW